MKATERVYWHESLPKYFRAFRSKSLVKANVLAEQIARDAGVTRATVHMTALSVDRR